MTSPVLRMVSALVRFLPRWARSALYRLGPVSRGLRQALTLAAPEELAVVEVAAGRLQGARLELDLKAQKTLWLGMYESELLEAIERFGVDGGVAFDVGANIGYITLALARKLGPNGRVVAFEPLPANIRCLRTNLRLNMEGGRVQVVEAAAGDQTTLSSFLIHRSVEMGKLQASKGRSTEYENTILVDMVALDDWVHDRPERLPNLVKIDVEGGEALVLSGMRHLLQTARPVLLMELHGPEAAAASREMLADAGYVLHWLREGYPAIEQFSAWKAQVVALPNEFPGLSELR